MQGRLIKIETIEVIRCLNLYMKIILPLLALGTFLAMPALAQSAGGTNSTDKPPHSADGGPGPGGHMGGLTPEERQELMADRKAVLDANPDLADQMKALQDKINAAMVKMDPKVAPLLAKMDAAHKQHPDGPGGPGSPGGSGSAGTSGSKPPPPPGN